MRIAGVKERPNDREAFAGMRMVRIVNNDFKRLLLGSMSCVRTRACSLAISAALRLRPARPWGEAHFVELDVTNQGQWDAALAQVKELASAAKASPRATLRPAMNTVAPSFANSRADARPMPP